MKNGKNSRIVVFSIVVVFFVFSVGLCIWCFGRGNTLTPRQSLKQLDRIFSEMDYVALENISTPQGKSSLNECAQFEFFHHDGNDAELLKKFIKSRSELFRHTPPKQWSMTMLRRDYCRFNSVDSELSELITCGNGDSVFFKRIGVQWKLDKWSVEP